MIVLKRLFVILAVFMMVAALFAGCSGKEGPAAPIVFADCGWDSARFHNAIAGIVAENAFGYQWSETAVSTNVMMQGVESGDISAHIETWSNQIPGYDEFISGDKVSQAGLLFDDNAQGIYVPRYVIEGDSSRGIEPTAPDLRTVEDLKKHAHVFPDDEQKDMGRIYGWIPGSVTDLIMEQKVEGYGLDEMYILFRPGSDAALSAALTAAYEKGLPIAAYYWSPTWLMGKYDFVLLEDAPFDPELFGKGLCEFEAADITIVVNNDAFADKPDMLEFFGKFKMSSALVNEALAYMQESGDTDYISVAKWFLGVHDELLEQWLAPDDAVAVRTAIGA